MCLLETYLITAVAYDDLNLQTASSVVTIYVNKGTTGIPSVNDSSDFKIYPNPNDGHFSVGIRLLYRMILYRSLI